MTTLNQFIQSLVGITNINTFGKPYYPKSTLTSSVEKDQFIQEWKQVHMIMNESRVMKYRYSDELGWITFLRIASSVLFSGLIYLSPLTKFSPFFFIGTFAWSAIIRPLQLEEKQYQCVFLQRQSTLLNTEFYRQYHRIQEDQQSTEADKEEAYKQFSLSKLAQITQILFYQANNRVYPLNFDYAQYEKLFNNQL